MSITEQQIRDWIGIEDIKIRRSDNDEYWWATVSRREKGHHYSRSKRVQDDATQYDVEQIGEDFNKWWDDESA